jgi:hypothetical protein
MRDLVIRLLRNYFVLMALFIIIAIYPVSAEISNGYYKVAPTIHQGATVFIGEQGLDISNALASARAQGTTHAAITTIGWWASAADIRTTAPTVSFDLIGRENLFTVTQAEFDGYEGQWYLVDANDNNLAKAGVGAVFNVKAPKLDVSVRDPYQNDGADVSGKSIPQGSKLQFQIGTNMYTVLANPLLRSTIYNTPVSGVNSDGYLDIRVKYEDGTTLMKLYDDNNLERTLLAINVETQPFTWGRANAGRGPGIDYVWNTSAYPPGTYVVSVQSKLNNMQSNYQSGTTAYSGRTVSDAKTITLIGGIPSTSAIAQAAKLFIRIDPIGDKQVCDKFTITAATNLAVNNEILVQVYSTSFKPTQKLQSGEFSGAIGTVKVQKGDSGFNKILFDLDTCTFKPDEYIVTEDSQSQNVTVTERFNILDGTAQTFVQTAVKTTVAPTAAGATISTTLPIDNNGSNTGLIWDRNNLLYVILLVFVLLLGALVYDTYYKKKK